MIVTLCTPTCNRRKFIPTMIKCIENQTYPKDAIEWIILDDGEDKIFDLVCHIPYVRYYSVAKMKLGEKRNLIHKYSKGEILIYIDDDDYYPPERIQRAVDTLCSNKELCVGSSIMNVYFTDLDKIYQLGPYGKYHSTAATLGFKRELLNKTGYNDNDTYAEEKFFLKKWTIPLIQLDTKETILVISHNKNTIDRKRLLESPLAIETDYTLGDFVKDPGIQLFYEHLSDDSK